MNLSNPFAAVSTSRRNSIPDVDVTRMKDQAVKVGSHVSSQMKDVGSQMKDRFGRWYNKPANAAKAPDPYA